LTQALGPFSSLQEEVLDWGRRNAGCAKRFMKVRILESARRDLRVGYNFYQRQEKGIGEYSSNALFTDIDSLTLHAGFTP